MQVQVLFSMDKVVLSDDYVAELFTMTAQWHVIESTFDVVPSRILVNAVCEDYRIPEIEALIFDDNPTIIVISDVDGALVSDFNSTEYLKFVPGGEVVHQFMGWEFPQIV